MEQQVGILLLQSRAEQSHNDGCLQSRATTTVAYRAEPRRRLLTEPSNDGYLQLWFGSGHVTITQYILVFHLCIILNWITICTLKKFNLNCLIWLRRLKQACWSLQSGSGVTTQAVVLLHRQWCYCTGSGVTAQAVVLLHRQWCYCTGSGVTAQSALQLLLTMYLTLNKEGETFNIE